MDYKKEIIEIHNDNEQKEKEEVLRSITEMLETLPMPELIRTYSYLSSLYFC